MSVSKYKMYFVVSKDGEVFLYSGEVIQEGLNLDIVEISEAHTYEIYTRKPDDLNIGGWDIKHVISTDAMIKHYPLFDCIITKNDSQWSECTQFFSVDTYLSDIK